MRGDSAGVLSVAAVTPGTTTIIGQDRAALVPQGGVFILRKIQTDTWVVETPSNQFNNVFSGLVPASTNSVSEYLRGNGTWGTLSISSGEIADNAVITSKITDKNVTLAKLEDIAALTILGNPTAIAGTPSAFTLAASLAFVSGSLGVVFGTTSGTACSGDDARLSDARTPTSHTHDASQIVSGTLAISNGGTGASTAKGAVTNLTSVSSRVTTSSFSLADSDSGTVIEVEATSAITITVPSGLAAGFNCVIIQGSTGQVTFAGTGGNLKTYNSLLKTAGQNAVVSIIPGKTTGTYFLGGNLVA
jgi:hypothetical protein